MQGMQDTLKVLKSLSEVTEIPSGCCGMAGSFGYEAEHSAFSKQIGELHLLPFIRKLPENTAIIANGYSCRTQISLYTDRKALHLAEWLLSLIF
jgi:Fe-S oxidoreductase